MIESLKNQRVKQWKKYSYAKERKKEKKFLVEGFHLIEEALRGERVLEIIIGLNVDIPGTWNLTNIPIFTVNEKIVTELTNLETPSSIFAVCSIIPAKNVRSAKKILLVDAVQNPGNLGAIIRTADAAGVDIVVLGQGCVDIYNDKVIQATQGSIFHVAFFSGKLLPIIEQLKQDNIPVYSSGLGENSISMSDVKPRAEFALIVGNEGSGISSDLIKASTEIIHIPIYGQAESLNVSVATGILLYQLQGAEPIVKKLNLST